MDASVLDATTVYALVASRIRRRLSIRFDSPSLTSLTSITDNSFTHTLAPLGVLQKGSRS